MVGLFRVAAASLIACALSAAGAYAQIAPDDLPGSADPARLETRPALPPEPRLGAPEASRVPGLAQEVPEGADTIRIPLEHIECEGARAYSQAELARIVAPHLGHDVPLRNLYNAAAAITAHYQQDGYILSRAIVPPQEL